jgi:Tfp pilus assembly protein PilV
MVTGLARDGSGGFALVDVLVAMAVTALAAAALTGLIAFTNRFAQSARATAEVMRGAAAAEGILQALTQDAHAPGEANRSASGPQGTPDEFTTTTFGPPVLALDHPTSFTLRVEAADRGKVLILVWRDEAARRERRERVAGPVRDATFSFFGQTTAAGERRWNAIWRAESGQPEAVRLTLVIMEGSHPVTIIARWLADVPAACLRNPRRAGCPTIPA